MPGVKRDGIKNPTVFQGGGERELERGCGGGRVGIRCKLTEMTEASRRVRAVGKLLDSAPCASRGDGNVAFTPRPLLQGLKTLSYFHL